MLLAQRLEGSGLRLVLVDGTRPLESQVADVVALVPSVARITAPVIAAAKNLKAIVQFGAGLDNVDREAAAARGIAVRNVPGANAQAVAELALFLMLALARRLPMHRRSFAARIVGDPPGSELSGKTLGIVGLGASGRQLARMARGIGMEVIAIRRNAAPDPDASWVGGPADLHSLLGRADYVSLHIPTSAETRNLMNAAAFRAMKPNASVINVGRGDLVDRAALIEALDTKTIAGAGLDVYWEEPPDPADPLLAREEVVATPHIGGVTEEALDRIATRVAEILKELVGPRPA
jgi:phosphoglycerate dehydrogenase-like enzyme